MNQHAFRINPDPTAEGPDACICGAMFTEGFNLSAMKVAHMEAHGVTPLVPVVGLEFHYESSRPYRLDGERGVHVRVDDCVITAVDEDGIEWEVVGCVSEKDRPPFAGYPTGGTMMLETWPRRIAEGVIRAAS